MKYSGLSSQSLLIKTLLTASAFIPSLKIRAINLDISATKKRK